MCTTHGSNKQFLCPKCMQEVTTHTYLNRHWGGEDGTTRYTCDMFSGSIMQYLCYLLGVLTVAFAQELEECFENCTEYRPHAPLVLCSYLPMEYLACIEPVDLNGNETRRLELDGFGCTKWGGERYEDVQKSKVMCIVLQGITCHGNRTFQKDGFPCIKYEGHYFVTTLIYSVLLGFLGMDRFCLGHTGTAVGKLMTLGGVGIWWIVDVVLLVTGSLRPEQGSNWVPYY
ncbi:TM2 domain-containing protein 2-like isoform X3 [Mya arenaria]|uniref:TM2 domain-containing protein 2-like isoform X3 n=1 Tax=Mya arenaria TaxID=6604 RepID=UPI0022E4A789|nr:TM2 domain-containing protein 2-like isoform X3 [Mya arenaria]